jgi:predicted kinase
MAGLPGSGKSTLAAAIAERTGAVVIDKDVIMAAAIGAGVEPEQAGAIAYEVALALAEPILHGGHDVILDSPANFTVIREKGADVAARTGARYYIIQCLVPEPAIAEERIVDRPPLHELHPTSYEGMDLDWTRPGTSPLSEPHLDIDTSDSPDSYLTKALQYIGHDAS